MTEVVYRNQTFDHSLEIKEHHADKAACAGISAIAWALAGAVTNRCDPDMVVLTDGYVNIRARGTKKTDKALRDFFFMAYIGLRQIALEYPDTIEFE